MAWVRLHDGALSHPKVIGIFDPRRPFDLWMWGLSYSQAHLTDGYLPGEAIPKGSSKALAVLVDRKLWGEADRGFQIHDYLDWNDSKAVVTEARQLAKVRMVLVRDPELRQALRDRDMDVCRYCAQAVNWADRKSRLGATYDHVVPGGGDTVDNLVIACRGCNNRKQKRTPEQAGMTLLPPPTRSISVSRSINAKNALIGSGLGINSSVLQKEKNGERDDSNPLERVVDAFRAQWKRAYGFESSLLLKPLEIMQIEQQLTAMGEARLLQAMAAYFTTDNDYVRNAKHPLPLFLRDPLKHLAGVPKAAQQRPRGCRHEPACADDAAHTKRDLAERRAS